METIPEKIEEIKNKPVSKINKNLNSTILLYFEGNKPTYFEGYIF